mmetsp:Transcript_61107/g.131435  ORF Transcript_61107/g.131435 Transcript_61107/m.131435 type:complete len:233 (-) Transcript_61107:365-1063(-)
MRLLDHWSRPEHPVVRIHLQTPRLELPLHLHRTPTCELPKTRKAARLCIRCVPLLSTRRGCTHEGQITPSAGGYWCRFIFLLFLLLVVGGFDLVGDAPIRLGSFGAVGNNPMEGGVIEITWAILNRLNRFLPGRRVSGLDYLWDSRNPCGLCGPRKDVGAGVGNGRVGAGVGNRSPWSLWSPQRCWSWSWTWARWASETPKARSHVPDSHWWQSRNHAGQSQIRVSSNRKAL